MDRAAWPSDARMLEALARLLQWSILQISPRTARCSAKSRTARGAAQSHQLFASPTPLAGPHQELRGLGGKRLRTPTLRNLLQNLYRKGMGHSVQSDQRRLGRTAHPWAVVGFRDV